MLVNDWSARDLQRWEYQPLGPFLGKSFATSISPWIVPLAALEPYLVPAREQDPEPLPYLRTAGDWALDLALEVELNGEVDQPHATRAASTGRSRSMLAHATVNGAAVRARRPVRLAARSPGPTPGSEGSLIELGRPFLADGDTVVLARRGGQRVASARCAGRSSAARPVGRTRGPLLAGDDHGTSPIVTYSA